MSHSFSAQQSELAGFLRTAEEVARAAGKNIASANAATRSVERTKSNNADLLTILDQQNEQQIMSTILERYPSHLFIAEETKAEAQLTDAPTWLIDPIDGTTNFVHRYHECCVSVALAIRKEVVVAAVYNPATNTMFSAVKGHGACCNGALMHVSACSSLDSALLSTNINSCKSKEMTDANLNALTSFLATKCHGYRMCGSAALNMSYVADGRLDAYFEIEVGGIWDVAAGMLLITEAGGVVLDILGGNFELKAGKQYILCGAPSLLPLLVPITRSAFAFTQSRFSSLSSSSSSSSFSSSSTSSSLSYSLSSSSSSSAHYDSICRYFKVSTASEIRWAHAVNDEARLRIALADNNVHMLEIDLSLNKGYPVMSHDMVPPSDAPMFDSWLKTFITLIGEQKAEHVFEDAHFKRATWCGVCQGFFYSPVGKQALQCVQCSLSVHRGRCLSAVKENSLVCTRLGRKVGLKLDFKIVEAVRPCLEILRQFQLPEEVPVWLNFDVMCGPSNPRDPLTAQPAELAAFLTLCREKQSRFPCSLGWTTAEGSAPYTDTMVERMLSVCQQYDLKEVTFAVKAALVRESYEQIQKLLQIPSASVTVWTSTNIGISASLNKWILESFDHRRLFVDVAVES